MNGARPRLLVATGNAGKVREIRAILAPSGQQQSAWDIQTPAEAGITLALVAEGGRSYAENAIAKAIAAAHASGLPALADDSGIEVDALDGAPGVTSARYGGPSMRNDHDRNALILRRLEGVPPAKRTARFRAIVALAFSGGRVVTREGVVEGRIALAPQGVNGFGYDPIFLLPDGRSMAELGDEKDRISHRALALAALRPLLAALRPQGSAGR
ncbi:MAG: RdgB/HAM1 family non-canonical purine NTP pyrophosphatase [Dehalococcoidia bacterium]|nr:RdgB/HAM1 family non-canonical purine NTP pyrophosphatase [Dehalococcoidia bacterium]